MNRQTKGLLFFLIVAGIIACRPTNVLQQNVTKHYKGNKIDRVVVRALPGKLGQPELFEKTTIRGIKVKGVEFIPAFTVPEMHDSAMVSNQVEMRKALSEKGYNGLFEIKLVSIREETSNSANQYPTRREYRIMDDLNYNKLIQEYGKREEKGADYEDIKVKMDLRMFDLNEEDNNVIWSGRTESVNPRNNKHIASGASKKASKYLKKLAVYGESK